MNDISVANGELKLFKMKIIGLLQTFCNLPRLNIRTITAEITYRLLTVISYAKLKYFLIFFHLLDMSIIIIIFSFKALPIFLDILLATDVYKPCLKTKKVFENISNVYLSINGTDQVFIPTCCVYVYFCAGRVSDHVGLFTNQSFFYFTQE